MSLFPEIDKEIELAIKLEKERLLTEYVPFECVSLDEAYWIETELCKGCDRYKLVNDIPSCSIIVEFLAIGDHEKIVDVNNEPVCVGDIKKIESLISL